MRVVEGLGLDTTKGVSDEIPAKAFRQLADIEARIACKIDSSVDLPMTLSSQGLFPLPVRNGAYVLVRGKGFHGFEPIDGPPKVYESKIEFDLVTAAGMGESIHVHNAYNSGLLSKFTGIDGLLKTNEGRFYAKEFAFNVGGGQTIQQRSTQIQVDGLFESRNCVIIVEAKTREMPDFIIRQLYYPFRHWSQETKKDVDTIFLGVDLDTGVYKFWQYHFNVPDDYASIEIVRKEKYSVIERPRGQKDLGKIAPDRQIRYVPQADSIDRIISIPYLVSDGIQDAPTLAEAMRFTHRQACYYSEATEALGLIERCRSSSRAYHFELTRLGEDFIASRPDVRNRMLAEQIMRLPSMNIIYDHLVEMSANSSPSVYMMSVEEIAGILDRSSYLTGSTPRRRAATIVSWFQWIGENYGVVGVSPKGLSLRKSVQVKFST